MLLTEAPCSDRGTKERHYRLLGKKRNSCPPPCKHTPPLPQRAFCFLISLFVTSLLTHSCLQLLSPGTNKTLQRTLCACQPQAARRLILLDPHPLRHLADKMKPCVHQVCRSRSAVQLQPGHGAAKHSRELEQDPQPSPRPCEDQSLTLWFRLERVKHIRSHCLLRRQKAALTSNIEAPRDTTEEFPLAGVCGKPYIKSRGRPVCFPRASRWESSNSFLALRCREKRYGHNPSCAFAEERQASLSPCPPVLLNSSSSSQKPLQTLLPDWTRPVPGFR